MSDQPSPLIHAAMAKCLGEVEAVGKNRRNAQQGYAFRALADVYKACQSVLAANGVHFAPFAVCDYVCEKLERANGGISFHVTMLVEHRFYASDGSYIPCVTIGEATDTSDKASNKAMSASAKYALVQAFCLPEEDPDADADHSSPEVVAPKVEAKTADAKQPAPSEEAKAKEAKALDLVLAYKKTGENPATILAWVSKQLGKVVTSSKDLTIAELDSLIATANNQAAKL